MVQGLVYTGSYTGPTLFVKGERSSYYKPGDESLVAQLFPSVEWVTLETGHWVQAEKPQEFAASVLDFLSKHNTQ
jgi:pimeloyl-ACP methyl ester carboxylesterase